MRGRQGFSETRAEMEKRQGFDQRDEISQRKPIKDVIFDALHQRIIAGKYAPGEWLRQEEISSQLGVSQTPVREALDLLVSAGLAERMPYRGVRVLKLSVEEIADAYAVRLLLERVAAHAAAMNRSSTHTDNLFHIAEQTRDLVTLNDMSALRQLNREFHQTVVAAGGNALLSKLYKIMTYTFPDWMLYEYMFRHPELLQSSLTREYQEHTAIAQAIAAGDAGLAVERTSQHIQELSRELVIYLEIPADLLKDKERKLLETPLPTLAELG
jgi:DNA-binding GntR family transcriptional regulator